MIKVGDDVMILKKGLDYIKGRQTFHLPSAHGDYTGLSLTIHDSTKEGDFAHSRRNFGLGVS